MDRQTKSTQKIKSMVRLAIFTAIIIIMTFTPLGYFKTGVIEITFLTIPVVVGAIMMGPGAGAFLGFVFGVTSFIMCFGMSLFGATLLNINPVFTFIVCVVPRTAMGWIVGLIFQGLYKIDKTKFFSFAATGLCGALLNTLFFLLFVMLFFSGFMFQSASEAGMTIMPYLVAFVGFNGLLEAAVSFVAVTAIGKALYVFMERNK